MEEINNVKSRKKDRPTIGFISDAFMGDYTYSLWQGVSDAARKADVNLVTFSLKTYILTPKTSLPEIRLLKLISQEKYDGMILCGGVISLFLGLDGLRAILERNSRLPFVNIGLIIDGVPSILADNYSGMFNAVDHLITKHNHKRICYIRGPENHTEERERFEGYKAALKKHNLELDDELVSPHFDWSSDGFCIDFSRGILGGTLSCDAIAAANDNMAISFYDTLQSAGIAVPNDLAIIGFDDLKNAGYHKYLLTTAKNPSYAIGCQAVESVLKRIKGEPLADVIRMPSNVIIRNSCGCSLFDVTHFLEKKTFDIPWEKYTPLKSYSREITGIINKEDNTDSAARHLGVLLGAFEKQLANEVSGVFLQSVDDLLTGLLKSEENIRIGENILVLLWQYVKYLEKKQNKGLPFFEKIFTNAWKMFEDSLSRLDRDRKNRVIDHSRLLCWTNWDVYPTFDLDEMLRVLTKRIPQFGIRFCYLSLFAGTDPSRARIIMGFDNKGKTVIGMDNPEFDSADLVPGGKWPEKGAFSVLVESLHVQDEQPGYIVFDAVDLEDFIFMNLTLQVSASLKAIFSIRKLRYVMGNVVEAMGLTVETRDPYTAGHQRRVSDLARTIAGRMNLDYEKTEGIRMAASIHDIGKIAVPTEILIKPSRLTDVEFSIIKVHPQAGYDILKNVDFPWPVAQIVYQHHEKINGSGYPLGLSGDEILIESRIVTVADVIEAMSSHRPYRPTLGIDAALEEIEKNKNILYDPDVVEVCLDLFRNRGYTLKS